MFLCKMLNMHVLCKYAKEEDQLARWYSEWLETWSTCFFLGFLELQTPGPHRTAWNMHFNLVPHMGAWGALLELSLLELWVKEKVKRKCEKGVLANLVVSGWLCSL